MKALETIAQRVVERNESRSLREAERGEGRQEAGRVLCGPDINCMVIINQLRGRAIWRGHRGYSNNQIRVQIRATAARTTSKRGGSRGVNNPLPHHAASLWGGDTVWGCGSGVCESSSEPKATPLGCDSTKGELSAE